MSYSEILTTSTGQTKIDLTSGKILKQGSASGVIAEATQGTDYSIVSGTNDGTNWNAITIDGTTKSIPSGGSGGSSIVVKSISLPTASWQGTTSPYSQTISLSDYTVTSNTMVDLQANHTVISQMLSDNCASIYVVNSNGTLYAYAENAKPTADLTVQATVVEVSST